MQKQALINIEETEIRVAILEDGTLVELFIENLNQKTKVGSIFKGRVESVVPGLKAVFVNIGAEKNAFLHYEDVLEEFDLPERGKPSRKPPKAAKASNETTESEDLGLEDEYIDPLETEEDPELVSSKRPPRKSRKLNVGDEILVQVTKDEINEKGARITSYISLPGRFLVMMPYQDEGGGVSRRIEDASERRRLKKLLADLKSDIPGSFIIRTAGVDCPEGSIRHDAQQLKETWQSLAQRTAKAKAPACVYEDNEILKRVVRDNFTDDINEILIDSRPAMRELILTCRQMVPDMVERIHLFDSAASIFDVFEVERQFQKALRRKVWLRSGGQLVIDETEALVAIDVNSGKYVGSANQEEVIFKTNLEACRAVAQQLRLRDLGGLIVIDFIDMNSRDHEVQVLREFKRCLRNDRAKYSISDFSEYGMVEMTRKRVRKSLARSMFRKCPYCDGSGSIVSDAQLWKQLKYDLMAALEEEPKVDAVDILVHSEFKTYLKTHVIEALSLLAARYKVALNIVGHNEFHHEDIKIVKRIDSMDQAKEQGNSNKDLFAAEVTEKKLESASAASDNAP